MAAIDLNRVKRLYNFVAQICFENGLLPYLPHNNTDPIINQNASDKEVFLMDYSELTNSSFVIAYIGEPSLGVGAELSICVTKNIPIIAIYETHRKVSRFLKGMLQTSNTIDIIEFENLNDLKEKLHYLFNRVPQLL